MTDTPEHRCSVPLYSPNSRAPDPNATLWGYTDTPSNAFGATEPGPVEDVQCQPDATHLALNWTKPAGDVGACLVMVEQLTTGGNAYLVFQANTSEDALVLSSLAPATSYRLSLTVLGRNGLWSRTVTLVCTTSAEGGCFSVPQGPPLLSQTPSITTPGGCHSLVLASWGLHLPESCPALQCSSC